MFCLFNIEKGYIGTTVRVVCCGVFQKLEKGVKFWEKSGLINFLSSLTTITDSLKLGIVLNNCLHYCCENKMFHSSRKTESLLQSFVYSYYIKIELTHTKVRFS